MDRQGHGDADATAVLPRAGCSGGGCFRYADCGHSVFSHCQGRSDTLNFKPGSEANAYENAAGTPQA